MTTRPQTSRADRIRHWPALARFYGLSLEELHTTPKVVLQVFLEEMPKLQAQEQLAAQMAADWPYLKKGPRTRIHKDLLEEAGWNTPAPVHPVRDVANLGAIGIKVVFEDPKGVSEAA